MSTSTVRMGVDTGGTFTDIVMLGADGKFSILKVDNASEEPQDNILRGALEILEKGKAKPADLQQIIHCTTILGNAILQRRGPKTALLTTKGFRDVLELRRQRYPMLYDVFWEKPAALVSRAMCREVTERIGADGEIIIPLDLEEARKVLNELSSESVISVAICLINACVNPAHEQQLAKLVRDQFPKLIVSISSEISPEWGEYERTSTTVTDAYVKPILSQYLGSLQKSFQLKGVRAALDVMQSSGGIMSAPQAIERAVYCLESGPAAGVVATCALSEHLGIEDAVTLEMGGTTAKSAIIEGGVAHRVAEYEIGTPVALGGRALNGGGYVLRIPVIDTAEVGAGGGSIAQVDAGGSLRVGPEGAGAVPGPICYGRGGSRVTVTDANVVLGYIREDHPLGGNIRIDKALAEKAVADKIAKPLGLSTVDAAVAIRAVANATMARAIRALTTERGRDVRRFAMFAFGGGGPGHAAEVARLLGSNRIVVPPLPGLFSALGLLWASLEQHYSRATKLRLDDTRVNGVLADLYRGLEAKIEAGGANGKVQSGSRSVERFVDLHYVGQFHDLTVPLKRNLAPSKIPSTLREAFEAEHRRTYGYASPDEAVEITNVRIVASAQANGGATSAGPKELSVLMQDLYRPSTTKTQWPIYFGKEFGVREASILSRADLRAKPIKGPIIIPEYDSTIVIPPDFQVSKDASGSVVIEPRRPASKSTKSKK